MYLHHSSGHAIMSEQRKSNLQSRFCPKRNNTICPWKMRGIPITCPLLQPNSFMMRGQRCVIVHLTLLGSYWIFELRLLEYQRRNDELCIESTWKRLKIVHLGARWKYANLHSNNCPWSDQREIKSEFNLFVIMSSASLIHQNSHVRGRASNLSFSQISFLQREEKRSQKRKIMKNLDASAIYDDNDKIFSYHEIDR